MIEVKILRTIGINEHENKLTYLINKGWGQDHFTCNTTGYYSVMSKEVEDD